MRTSKISPLAAATISTGMSSHATASSWFSARKGAKMTSSHFYCLRNSAHAPLWTSSPSSIPISPPLRWPSSLKQLASPKSSSSLQPLQRRLLLKLKTSLLLIQRQLLQRKPRSKRLRPQTKQQLSMETLVLTALIQPKKLTLKLRLSLPQTNLLSMKHHRTAQKATL